MDFSEEQLERYSRHIILQAMGIEGQKKISRARILIIGAGGLGSPAALYLAAAGIGTIGIADADDVELSNLQRQIIHSTGDLGKPKVTSAADKLKSLNPDVTVNTLQELVTSDNIGPLLKSYDFIIDGTDNFNSKFLINDACVMEKVPFSHGGVLQFEGQTMTVIPGKSACYRCVYSVPPPAGSVPSCSEAGVLGAVAGIMGTIQAAEALKFITGTADLLTDSLLTCNAGTMDFHKVKLKRNPHCPVCGESPTIHKLTDGDRPDCR
jgi:adenylyltransferase/sulfurtransferase